MRTKRFAILDNKLCFGIKELVTGPLESKVKSLARIFKLKRKLIPGRVLAWMVCKFFQMDDDDVNLVHHYAFSHLKIHDDNLAKYQDDWERLYDELTTDPDPVITINNYLANLRACGGKWKQWFEMYCTMKRQRKEKHTLPELQEQVHAFL